MVTRIPRKLQLTLLVSIVLIGALLLLFGWGPWSPTNRARSHTLAATQQLYQVSPFTILDQVSEEYIDQNGCRINLITLRIGSPVSLTESVALFTNAIQKIGWIQQPDDYAGLIYYFKRTPGEILVLNTLNIGPREWLQPPDSTTNYSAELYVQIASGATYTGFCDHF